MPGQSLHDPRLQAQHMPPFQQPQQAQHQASLDQHRIAELQDLHMRMQKLQLQMDQLTTSVQERRASAPPNAQETAPPSVPGMPGMPDIQGLSSSLPKAAGHFGSPSASMHGGTNPSASTDPGPCPFPAYPNMPRFEELDDNEASGTGGPPVGTGRRASTTSSMPADAREEQIELETVLREGKAARARSTTVSFSMIG